MHCLSSCGCLCPRGSYTRSVTRLTFLFRSNNISVYVRTTFCSSVHLSMDIWLPPPFGSCEGRCCEHGRANSFSASVLFGHVSVGGIAGSHGGSMSNFGGTSVVVSTVAAPSYTPSSSTQGSNFFTSSWMPFCDFFFLNKRQSKWI